MNWKILLTLLLVLLFTLSSFAQKKSENLLENVELKFTLQGEPTPQDVGFDNPKSYWKVKYEIYVTDFSEQEKLGLSEVDDEGYKYLAPITENKKFNKQIKKKSMKILRGSFTKKMLLTEANREVVILVNLPQNIVEIFNQAKNNPEKNPTFVLLTTQKVSVKNSDKAKLKRKQFLLDFVPLRIINDNKKQVVYRDLKTMNLNTRIVKGKNGNLEYRGGLFHGLGW